MSCHVFNIYPHLKSTPCFYLSPLCFAQLANINALSCTLSSSWRQKLTLVSSSILIKRPTVQLYLTPALLQTTIAHHAPNPCMTTRRINLLLLHSDHQCKPDRNPNPAESTQTLILIHCRHRKSSHSFQPREPLKCCIGHYQNYYASYSILKIYAVNTNVLGL